MNKTSTPVIIKKPSFKISKDDSTLVIGSCFAANVGAKLAEEGYDVCVNPFGTVFNPASVASSILRLDSGIPFTEDECVQMGAGSDLWCSFSHYTKFARPTKQEFLDHANASLAEASAFFHRCNRVIITFGTAYVFEHLPAVPLSSDVLLRRTPPKGPLPLMLPRVAQSSDSGTADRCTIVSNCLKRDAKEFRRYRMTVEEIVEMWRPVLEGPLAGKEVIFTVSPIRHMADTAHGNQLSKATLLMAVDELLGEGREYFPSYEIVLDELRDYKWFAEDLVHPNEEAVAIVWDRFKEFFIE